MIDAMKFWLAKQIVEFVLAVAVFVIAMAWVLWMNRNKKGAP